jgi:DNA-directed RNA polymerase specialized sigma24 family protein
LTPSEAAAVCSVSPETLRQRLVRARAALAARLDLPRSVPFTKRSYGT